MSSEPNKSDSAEKQPLSVPPMPKREAFQPADVPRKKPSLMTLLMVIMTAGMAVVTLAVLTVGSMVGPIVIMGLGFVALLILQYWIWGRMFEKLYRSDEPSPVEPPPPMRERL